MIAEFPHRVHDYRTFQYFRWNVIKTIPCAIMCQLLAGNVPLFESFVDPKVLNMVLNYISQSLSTVTVSRDIDPSGSTMSMGICLHLSWSTLMCLFPSKTVYCLSVPDCQFPVYCFANAVSYTAVFPCQNICALSGMFLYFRAYHSEFCNVACLVQLNIRRSITQITRLSTTAGFLTPFFLLTRDVLQLVHSVCL
jgi:hypothetical protein